MLSLQECRKILGPTCSLNDLELENYRDSLYALADISLNAYPKLQSSREITLPIQPKSVTFESMLNLLSKAEQEETIERAAIMEFEGGLTRQIAQKASLSPFFPTHDKRN
jgi:hypothetical protein